jgi:AcrR family transcriptional regulator
VPDKTTAERIVEAAAELFAERGYSATTTRALAQRAGVNEVTIFRLFGSKLGVLMAIGERLAVQGAAQQASAEPLPEDLHAAVTALAMREVDAASQYGAVAMRLAFDAKSVPEIAALMGEGPSANARAIAAFFAEQQRAGRVRTDIDARLIADAFFALTSTFVMSRMLLGAGPSADIPNEEAVRQLVDVLLAGVGSEASRDGGR